MNRNIGKERAAEFLKACELDEMKRLHEIEEKRAKNNEFAKILEDMPSVLLEKMGADDSLTNNAGYADLGVEVDVDKLEGFFELFDSCEPYPLYVYKGGCFTIAPKHERHKKRSDSSFETSGFVFRFNQWRGDHIKIKASFYIEVNKKMVEVDVKIKEDLGMSIRSRFESLGREAIRSEASTLHCAGGDLTKVMKDKFRCNEKTAYWATDTAHNSFSMVCNLDKARAEEEQAKIRDEYASRDRENFIPKSGRLGNEVVVEAAKRAIANNSVIYVDGFSRNILIDKEKAGLIISQMKSIDDYLANQEPKKISVSQLGEEQLKISKRKDMDSVVILDVIDGAEIYRAQKCTRYYAMPNSKEAKPFYKIDGYVFDYKDVANTRATKDSWVDIPHE